MLGQERLDAVGTEPAPVHVGEQCARSPPRRLLEPCLESDPDVCGQRRASFLPPFADASHMGASAEMDGVPVEGIAGAQSYPTRPITMIVPFAAGGLRIVAERMKESLGRPIVIENVTGADGSIGTGRAARARPDGYTIDLGFLGTHVLNGALFSLQYDVLNDFAPISPLAAVPAILFAKKTMPGKDVKELIAWLKANPNKASMGITIPSIRLLTAVLEKELGTAFNLVPYRIGPLAMQDLVAGRIDLTFGGVDQLPLVRAGTIKAYAVTSEARMAFAPDLPTFAEMGLAALSYSTWWAIFAPKDTPRDIVGKLNVAVVETLADPAVRSRLTDLGLEIFPRDQQTPEVLGTLVKSSAEKWWPVIKEFGIKAE
jgi:tripartite-type tricarboxylate transporter receptor subunit TctC